MVNVSVGKVTIGAFKLLLFYFGIIFGLIFLMLIHGIIVAIINGMGGQTIGFAEVLFTANKMFLSLVLLPVGLIILGILIIKIFFPSVATLLVDMLNNIFAVLGWNFSPLLLGQTAELTNFYFGLVDAFAKVLLNISVFNI